MLVLVGMECTRDHTIPLAGKITVNYLYNIAAICVYGKKV